MTAHTAIDPRMLDAAVAALRRGELVAFPTETVYGLGADAANEAAVRRIFAAKGRPVDHPLIVHLAGQHLLEQWAAALPETAQRLAARFWPGPLTLILPRAPGVLDVVTGGQASIGLRVPDHPVAQALLGAFGGGIAAPSANRFGRISPTRAAHVRAELGDAVAMVLDGGPARVGVESTIVDVTGPQPVLLRPGHISAAEIAHVAGVPLGARHPATPRASGMLASHYAPVTPVQLCPSEHLVSTIATLKAANATVAVLAYHPAPAALSAVPWVTLPDEPHGYAHALYASLRDLDERGYNRIIVEAVPDDQPWDAIRDRLSRAAHHTSGSST